jgi:hypothetical protein
MERRGCLKNMVAKNLVYFLLFLLTTAGTVTAFSDNEIKYVDPDNENNYIIFNEEERSYFLTQPDGDYSGTYTENSMCYSLSPFDYTIVKNGAGIKAPNGEIWKRV